MTHDDLRPPLRVILPARLAPIRRTAIGSLLLGAILDGMFRLHKISRFQQAIITLALLGLLTLGLLVSGLLDTAARLSAYATVILAIGTTGLAAGAIGTYIEQRTLTRLQATELSERTLTD